MSLSTMLYTHHTPAPLNTVTPQPHTTLPSSNHESPHPPPHQLPSYLQNAIDSKFQVVYNFLRHV